MDTLFKLLTIAAMGAVLIWAAVPAGLGMGLHPAVVAAATAIGSILTVLVVVLVGEPVRAWLLKRLGPQLEQALRSASRDPDSPRQEGAGRSLIVRVWERYGFIGLALVAPLFPGPAGAAALALALGIPGRRVFLWICAGIILWTTAFTLAVTLGITGFRTLHAAR
jgi:uncharacterized membrane protein